MTESTTRVRMPTPQAPARRLPASLPAPPAGRR